MAGILPAYIDARKGPKVSSNVAPMASGGKNLGFVRNWL